MPKISVIVPVYKAEKFLKECIDSILSQTFSDFELLLIDDGSPDCSGKICDEYAKKDMRVKVIHQQNKGANAARKNGVEKAHGEWVSFCDADDTLTKTALEDMYSVAEETDLVIGFLENPKIQIPMSLEECRKEIITGGSIPPTPVAKLYRKNILKDETFDFPCDIKVGEDMIMNIRIFFQITRAPHFIFKKVYNYRRNTSSISHTIKASLAYEEMFDNLRISSIPKEKISQYMRYIISSRLNGLTGVAYSSPNYICNGKSNYIRLIKADIKNNHYRCGFREWMILHLRPAILLRCFAFLVKVRNFAMYHFRLLLQEV